MAKKFSDLAGACWKGYKAVGLKDKNGKKVPNCVPEEVQMEAKKDEEETVDRVERSDYKVSPSGRKSHKQIVFKMGDEEMKENTNLEEATVKTKTYSWGTMKTVHHGADFSIPLHPEHHQAIAKLKDEQEHNFKTEDGKSWTARRKGDEVHFQGANGGNSTKVKHETMVESVPAKNTDIADKSYLKDMGKKPTIKSDLKNFKNFLTGKKETNEEVEQVMEAAPFKTKEDAVNYAKEKVKTHRDNLDGIEIYAHSGGFDVNHTMNSSGRNSLQKIKAKHLGTIYKEEVEQVEEGWYEKPASAYRRKGDEIGGGSSKNDVPFDGPYTKTKPTKNSDGTTQSPMSRARELAKQAIAASRSKIKEDVVDEQAPVAPVPDKKYIKGTPENKAYKATKKPINGMPTNKMSCEEAEQIDELDTKTLKSYINKNIKSGDTSSNRDEGLYTATNKVAKRLATSTLDKKVKTLGQKRPSETKNRFEYEASRSELKDRGIHHFAGRRTRTEEVELDESVFDSKDDAQSIANKLKTKNDDGNYSVVADHGKHRIVHAYHSDSRVKKDIAKLNEEQIDEANHREFASQGKMHPDMAKHMSVGQEMDYYEHGTGDKVSGKVLKNDGKEVHMKQTHDSYDPKKKGTVHKFTVSSKLDEKAPPGFEGTVKAMKKHKEIDNPYALAWYMKNKGMKSHKEEFDDNGELITNMKSYKEFLESLDEVKMSDLPSRKVSGKYGTEYYKGEAEKDVKGYDDEDTPAKPAGEKRGRGRPAGSTSGARQKGTIAKRKGSGVEMTGYPVHLPNFK